MLTVLHRSAGGDETILCDVREVRKVMDRPTGTPESTPTSPFYTASGIYVTFDGGGETHFGWGNAAHNSQEPPMIFVMNENGATVAKYRL